MTRDHPLHLSFHARSIAWLALAACLLGAGLYAAFSGQRALAQTQVQRSALAASAQTVQQSRQRAETYQDLIERIGWRPGQLLRHETIDTSALIASHETDRLNEILHATHVGKGQFFLRSLSIESQPSRGGDAHVLRVSLKGDNILVLDRP